MKPAIESMRNWLLGCPAISGALGCGDTVRIHFLSGEAVEFSIEDTPTDPIVQRYFSGAVKAKNYSLVSCMEYSENDAVQAANSGIFDDIADWVERQDAARRYPDLGYRVDCVQVTTTGYLVSNEAGSCRFQIQLQLQYYQPKGANP